MFHKLRWRIAIPFIILVVFSLAAMGVYYTRFMNRSYTQALENELYNEARMIRASIQQMGTENIKPGYLNQKAKNWSNLSNKRVTIIGADGTVLGESDEDLKKMENHLTRPEIQLALSQGYGSSIRYSKTKNQSMMYVAVPIYINQNLTGFVRLALPLNIIEENIKHIERTLAATLSIALVLIIAVTIWLSSRITKPIQDLTQFASRISGEGGNSYENLSGIVEIDKLTSSINYMTEELQAQITEIEIERSRLSAVLSVMTDGVIIVNEQNLVQLINPAALRMFRVTANSIEGQSLSEILPSNQLNELRQKSQLTGETLYITLELTEPQSYLRIIATPLGDALPDSTLLLSQDITQVRQLETIRQDFMSNISHELRTPIASLRALTETLQEGAIDDPKVANRFLSLMETEVDSLSLLVSELLELARIESGKVPLDLTPTNPFEILSRAIKRLNIQIERAGLKISLNGSQELPLINAEHSRLEQVIVNLVHNAIKFTPAGGEIILSARARQNCVIFSVSDNGVGIPSDDIKRIFERFYKSDRSRTGSGTGLGLAISRHLIEAHGGRIWVKSNLGEGSTFYFTIPVANKLPFRERN